jgi:hypothetical protein
MDPTINVFTIASAVFTLLWIVPSLTLVPAVARARLGGAIWLVWILVSLVFSPPLALIALAAMPVRERRDETEDERIACPFCAEAIRLEAIVCPHCQRDLTKGDVHRLRPR